MSSLDGSNGFVISGVTPNEESGRALAVADLNGDGVDDIIIGGTGGDGALLRGATYVVYGASAGFPAILSVDKYRRHEWVCRPRT